MSHSSSSSRPSRNPDRSVDVLVHPAPTEHPSQDPSADALVRNPESRCVYSSRLRRMIIEKQVNEDVNSRTIRIRPCNRRFHPGHAASSTHASTCDALVSKVSCVHMFVVARQITSECTPAFGSGHMLHRLSEVQQQPILEGWRAYCQSTVAMPLHPCQDVSKHGFRPCITIDDQPCTIVIAQTLHTDLVLQPAQHIHWRTRAARWDDAQSIAAATVKQAEVLGLRDAALGRDEADRSVRASFEYSARLLATSHA